MFFAQSAAESFSKIQEIVNGVVGKLPKGRRASKKQICREAAVAVEESASALASVGVRVSVSTFTTITIDGEGPCTVLQIFSQAVLFCFTSE